jgi:dTDP-4-dehydrorhamnose reductase
MSRILVTGARGLLGAELVPHLSRLGHEVVSHANRPGVQVAGDLSDAETARELFESISPDVIINLAALTNVDECERNPQRAFLANVRLVENLASAIGAQQRRAWLVQISTDQVYDGAGIHTEDEVTLTNYYGFSKYAGELAAARVPATILRTNFFGRSHSAGRHSLSDWLFDSLSRGQHITVFDDVFFSPVSLGLLASLISVAVEKCVPGTYNLGSRAGMSKAQFALALAKVLDLPTGSVTVGSSASAQLAAYRPKDMRMDPTRFERAFGVVLPTLEEEITSMRRAYV